MISMLGKSSFEKAEFIVSLKDFNKLSYDDFCDLFAANSADNYFDRSLEAFIEEEEYEEDDEDEDENEDEAKIDNYYLFKNAGIEQKI